jgi:hypothetical protein
MSMPALDPRRSMPGRGRPRMSVMDILLVIILIAAIGLFAQVAGADSRGFSRGRAA